MVGHLSALFQGQRGNGVRVTFRMECGKKIERRGG